MPVLKSNKVDKNLQKKGFIKIESHHHYFEFWHQDKLIARTRTSHNNQDINSYLISSMSKECRMPKQFFIEFCKCTKDKKDYITLLEENEDI